MVEEVNLGGFPSCSPPCFYVILHKCARLLNEKLLIIKGEIRLSVSRQLGAFGEKSIKFCRVKDVY